MVVHFNSSLVSDGNRWAFQSYILSLAVVISINLDLLGWTYSIDHRDEVIRPDNTFCWISVNGTHRSADPLLSLIQSTRIQRHVVLNDEDVYK